MNDRPDDKPLRTLTPEEAHAINRLMDPPTKTDPLRRYVPLYRTKAAGVHLGAIAFDTQTAAWSKPRGPNVPADLEILDVVEVRPDLSRLAHLKL